MSEQSIFKGTVLDVSESNTISVKCYDGLQKLNSEHIPKNDGYYSGVDAGAIIKDIVTSSKYDLDSGGISVSTGVIISEIDLTDRTRLQALQILLHLANGANDDDKIYHLYVSGGYVIFAPLPDYSNSSPAITLTDTDIEDLKIDRKGANYFNCATCIGKDGVRAYYPQGEGTNESPVPDFPDKPSHKLIDESSLIGVASCYAVARGWVRTHNQVPNEIDVKFVPPDRYDFFPGQEVRIDSAKRNIQNNFRIRTISWSYDLKKTMGFKLSDVEVFNLSTYI